LELFAIWLTCVQLNLVTQHLEALPQVHILSMVLTIRHVALMYVYI